MKTIKEYLQENDLLLDSGDTLEVDGQDYLINGVDYTLEKFGKSHIDDWFPSYCGRTNSFSGSLDEIQEQINKKGIYILATAYTIPETPKGSYYFDSYVFISNQGNASDKMFHTFEEDEYWNWIEIINLVRMLNNEI